MRRPSRRQNRRRQAPEGTILRRVLTGPGLERGFTPTEFSGILSIGKRLVHSYLDVVHDHHPSLVVGDPQPGEPSCSPMD